MNISSKDKSLESHAPDSKEAEKKHIAVISQSLFLCNLLILPGVAFLVLCYYAYTRKRHALFTQIHILRAFQFSLASGVVLAVLPFTYWWLANQSTVSLVPIVLYFVTFHAAFVLIGMLNLAKAMSKKTPLF